MATQGYSALECRGLTVPHSRGEGTVAEGRHAETVCQFNLVARANLPFGDLDNDGTRTSSFQAPIP